MSTCLLRVHKRNVDPRGSNCLLSALCPPTLKVNARISEPFDILIYLPGWGGRAGWSGCHCILVYAVSDSQHSTLPSCLLIRCVVPGSPSRPCAACLPAASSGLQQPGNLLFVHLLPSWKYKIGLFLLSLGSWKDIQIWYVPGLRHDLPWPLIPRLCSVSSSVVYC